MSHCKDCYNKRVISTGVLHCKEHNRVVEPDNYCTMYQPVKYYPRGLYRTSNKAKQAKQAKQNKLKGN